MRKINLNFRKWPDAPHYRYEAEYLGEDEWGYWVLARKGTPFQRGDGQVSAFSFSAVELIPREQWFQAMYSPTWPAHDLYVHVAMPPRWDGDVVTILDLDLDVIRSPAGVTTLLDSDEFELHSTTLGYPPDMVQQARSTAVNLMELVAGRAEPFGTAVNKWLGTDFPS